MDDQSTTPTPYKPSPLSFNSPRQSPFRRPGSVRDRSPSTVRPSTPSSSPLKPREAPATSNASQHPPSWLNTRATTTTSSSSCTTGDAPTDPTRNMPSATARPLSISTASLAARFDGGRDSTPPLVERSTSADKLVPAERFAPVDSTPVEKHSPYDKHAAREKPAGGPPARPAALTRTVTSDALSKLPPALLHSMRESFSVLDSDNDGHVNSADVADMLSQLGLSATPSALAPYFNGAQSINLATFLNTLSDLLSGLSRSSELSAAFEAFDDADDGQIDLAELKDALLHTAPEPGEPKLTDREIDMVVEGFSGRRAFGKGAKGLGRGDIFRYHEFMASLTGGGGGGSGGENGHGTTTAPA